MPAEGLLGKGEEAEVCRIRIEGDNFSQAEKRLFVERKRK